jgi:hypothetical membrane protein
MKPKAPAPTADDTTAFVIPLHQVPPRKKDKTGAKRAKAYRQRKKQKANPVVGAEDGEITEPPVTPRHDKPVTQLAVTTRPPVTPSRRNVASALLTTAALALCAVGITINGWYARSLGASDVAGWLFLTVGVAADLVVLVMPSCAAGLWQAGQRPTALVGWTLWLVAFIFAVTAGIGFASTNVSDVTLARASRVTPAVAVAQAALSDAMTARDRECKGGLSKFCREREAAVAERRQILDAAMAPVGKW